MWLASCVSEANNELVCDFAEYYHIYNYTEHNPVYVSILAKGLRRDSRTMQKLNNEKYSFTEYLQGMLVDDFNMYLYSHTQDAKSGTHKPKSIISMMRGEDGKRHLTNGETQAFRTGEDFEKARNRILGR